MTEIEEKQKTGYEYQTAVEPEFKPFEFGSQNESQPAFEIEKQYNFDPNSYREFGEKARQMDFATIEKNNEEKQKQSVTMKKEIVASPRLNARGKIIVSVYSIIVAIIIAFCIYNAVVINSLSGNIAHKQEIVATQSQVINDLSETYNSLGDEDNIKAEVENKFKKPQQEDKVEVDDFVIGERPKAESKSNWFEDFCRKLRNLFS